MARGLTLHFPQMLQGVSMGVRRLSSWLLYASVALAPLPFGSFAPTAVAFWCLVLGVCVIGAASQPLSGRQLALVAVIGSVVAAYGFVLHEQLAALPWFGRPDPIWHQAEIALGQSLPSSVARVRGQPWLELGRPLVCVLAVTCGFLIGADRHRARQLMKVFAWSGAIYAVYAILAHIFDPAHILWRYKEAYLGYATGTFINRNTAGAYFGSCAVVWSLLFWERVRLEMPRGPIHWRTVPARLFAAMPRKIMITFAMMFGCLAAMFMTGSRGAVILSLLALIVAFTAFFRRDLPQRTGLLNAIIVAAAIALVVFQLMGAGVSARLDASGLADGGRLATYRSTLRLIADHPWFGTGQGTFAYVFPAYRSPDNSMRGVWDIAHNSLLEVAADMGIPVAVLVVAVWMIGFGLLIHGARSRRRDLLIPVAALAVAFLAVLHSLVDFTLQIPGYSIVALALIGAGVAQSFGSNERRESAVRAIANTAKQTAAGAIFEREPRSRQDAFGP